MTTVQIRSRHSAKSTARDMRTLMRDQGVNTATLAWILRSGYLRALLLRGGSTSWTVDEVCRLVDACGPGARSVPMWGLFVELV